MTAFCSIGKSALTSSRVNSPSSNCYSSASAAKRLNTEQRSVLDEAIDMVCDFNHLATADELGLGFAVADLVPKYRKHRREF